MEEVDYKVAITALLNEDYDRTERTRLANQIADGICEGYKNEIDYLQEKYGDGQEERLENVIRNGLVHVTYMPDRPLTDSERMIAAEVLATVITTVEALEVLRVKGVAR